MSVSATVSNTAAATSDSPPPFAPKRPLRILYADDVPELRDVARISFSRDGHEIECVADGALAVARLDQDMNFDLVITDHHMPNMNGTEVVMKLRELNFPGKIMVFSSDLGSLAAAEYARLRVDRIIYKPVYPSALRQAINDLFPEIVHAKA